MGTGGTLPTTITQTVTLYNTTGLIEKEKSIYFCPFLSTNSAKKVCEDWLTAFNTAVSYDSTSGYSNIQISQWSPKDRVLKVKGNIDDFRLVTNYGKCLNYLILTRIIDTNKTEYYSFFITAVEQVGIGAVSLTLESDNFTDVFFLHNKNLSSSYSGTYVDVFNERLKNCYVNRQHYNRVKKVDGEWEYIYIDDNSTQGEYDVWVQVNLTGDHILTQEEVDNLTNGSLNVSISSVFDETQSVSLSFPLDCQCAVDEETVDIRVGHPLSCTVDFNLGRQEYEGDTIKIEVEFEYQENPTIEQDNLPIFSQIEEGFKYKRQFRDYKEFINYGDPLTEEEKQAYENATSWSNLSSDLKIKALKLSLAFVNITFNSDKIFLYFKYPSSGVLEKLYCNLTNSSLKNTLPTFSFPIVTKVKVLEKFWESIKSLSFSANFVKFYSIVQNDVIFNDTHLESLMPTELNDILKEGSPYLPYINSVYISKESSLIDNITFRADGIDIKVETNVSALGSTSPTFGLLKLGLSASDITNIVNGTYYFNYGNPQEPPYQKYLEIHTSNQNDKYIMLPTNSNNKKVFNLDLDDSVVTKNLKTEYFDTVLTFNPYSFYSVSYLGRIEVPLNKLNYYENSVIECSLSVVTTDVYKYSFTPTYEVGGKKVKYYSEGIELSFSNNLTLSSSELVNYTIANQTQMRNQYAVNDLNRDYGLIEAGLGTIENIASGVGKGLAFGSPEMAGAGAIAGAVQGISNLVNTGIDWDKNRKQIAMNQKAKLSDMGNLPSNLKQVGTDIIVDLLHEELGLYLNHYTIDEVSYNSICKYLERFGYLVNIYDNLNVNTRKGWDFVKVISFDYEDKITVEQEESIRQILANGVTLLHDKSYMTSGHNYEIILD